MVEGVVGLPGSGKTYILTMRAFRAMAKGIHVFANYHLKGALYFDSWADLISLTEDLRRERFKSLICIDEVNLWAPSRFWQKIPEGVLYLWAQTRKRKIDVLWSSQSEKRVDTVIREVTNYVWYCFSLGPFTVARSYYPEDLRKAKSKPLRISLVLRKGRIYRLYDTFEMIEVEKSYSRSKGDVLRAPNVSEESQASACPDRDFLSDSEDVLVGDLLRQYMESKRGGMEVKPNGHDTVEWW